MTYDSWKTTNPDDEFLGPAPDAQDQHTQVRQMLDRAQQDDRSGDDSQRPTAQPKPDYDDQIPF